jgi:hypothetical protein
MAAWSRIAAIIVAMVALGVSLRAATLWWKASNVGTPNPPVASIVMFPSNIMATQSAAYEAALLNARAAKWTGAAAIPSAAASILGLL